MNDFTWEALATFAAGFMAIAGAIYVGRKQSTILSRQLEITSKQSDLEHLKLKSDLFERRLKVFNAVMEWRGFIQARGKAPDRDDIAFEMHEAVQISKFLFEPKVSEQLKLWLDMGYELNTYKEESQSMENIQAGAAKLKEIVTSASSDNVISLFSNEMQLSYTDLNSTRSSK